MALLLNTTASLWQGSTHTPTAVPLWTQHGPYTNSSLPVASTAAPSTSVWSMNTSSAAFSSDAFSSGAFSSGGFSSDAFTSNIFSSDTFSSDVVLTSSLSGNTSLAAFSSHAFPTSAPWINTSSVAPSPVFSWTSAASTNASSVVFPTVTVPALTTSSSAALAESPPSILPTTTSYTTAPFPPSTTHPPSIPALTSSLSLASSTSSDLEFFVWNSTTFSYSSTTSFPASVEVTSTVTDVPPAVSTQVIASITTNGWHTAWRDGQHIIVPVIHCDICGGGVIIWGLHQIHTGIQFDFHLHFPGLPKFKFPCIKVFGVRISGDCPSPQSHGDGEDDGGDDNEDDNQEPSSTQRSTASTSTSSESSCTHITATNTAVSCSPIITGSLASQTTLSCSTSTSAFSGCSVTGTATTTTGTTSALPTSPFCGVDGACRAGSSCHMAGPEKRELVQPANFDTFMAHSYQSATYQLMHRVSTGWMSSGFDEDEDWGDDELSDASDDADPNGSEDGDTDMGEAEEDRRRLVKRWTWPSVKADPKDGYDARNFIVDPKFYGVSSAVVVHFEAAPVTVALQGLHGCTSVVVISRRGVWMSHLWEMPSMILEDFWLDVIPAIFTSRDREMEGLDSTLEPGDLFDPATRADDNLQVFIMTPDDMMRRTGVEKWAGDGIVAYPEQVAMLKAALQLKFGVSPTVYPYYRVRMAVSPLEVNDALGVRSKDDLHRLWRTTSSGHYFVEYDPKAREAPPQSDDGSSSSDTPMTDDSNDCPEYQAGFKLWVDAYRKPEQEGRPLAEFYWDPLREQGGPDPDDKNIDPNLDRPLTSVQRTTKACLPKSEPQLCSFENCSVSCSLAGSTTGAKLVTSGDIPDRPSLFGRLASFFRRASLLKRMKMPWDYADFTTFILEEVRSATRILVHGGTIVNGRGQGQSTSRVDIFGREPFNVVLTGMAGCTSVVVASRKGVWISHFWETPGFQDDANFRSEILDGMWTGRDATFPGLNRHIQPGGIFDPNDASLNVQIVMFVPQRVPYSLEDFRLGIWNEDIEPVYVNKWRQIGERIAHVWPRSTWKQVGYAAVRVQRTIFSVAENRHVESPITLDYQQAVFAGTVYGKILVQYDPAMIPATADCPSVAGYKVWMDEAYPRIEDLWPLSSFNTQFSRSRMMHLHRQQDVCTVPSVTETTWATVGPPPATLPTASFTSSATSSTNGSSTMATSASIGANSSFAIGSISVVTVTTASIGSNTSFTFVSVSTRTVIASNSSTRLGSMSTGSATVSANSTFIVPPFLSTARSSSTSSRPSTSTMPSASQALSTTASSTFTSVSSSRSASPRTSSTALPTRSQTPRPSFAPSTTSRTTTTARSTTKTPTTTSQANNWYMGNKSLTTMSWGIVVPVTRTCGRGDRAGRVVTRRVDDLERVFDCVVAKATMTAIAISPAKPKV